jgi:phospholipid/cholesterol/gamma-HCH transport system ATP-binding protein
MIQVENLTKRFDHQEVLKNVNLEIYDHETLVILGPSGQGKTVLIKTLIRLLEPESGSIRYDDVNILKMNKKELDEFRKHVAFVFQNSALFDFLDVKENLGLFLRMHTKLSNNEIEEKIRNALSFVGLREDIYDKFPEELSGGMKKRVAIARAMIKEPKYIFYDEPTTGLDKANAKKISNLIHMLKDKISPISVIVTHALCRKYRIGWLF